MSWFQKWNKLWLKHWFSWTRFYNTWRAINNRCCETYYRYDDYWWRWIVVLRSSFEEFKNDMYESYIEHIKEFWEKQTTIDRIDNSWNYCKDNCRWATQLQQQQNTRKNKNIEIWWETKNLFERLRVYNIKRATYYRRIEFNRNTIDAITKPIRK